ncbi:MAG: TIGR00730 family Rossman fold protein [Bacteroidales bacterium]|nr:TIGR00730 family Rossman fold protein [Bacteroidales bacterium]
MNIGVFCSANKNVDKAYLEATQALGMWIGRGGHSLVWGGCRLGLMETIAENFLLGAKSLSGEQKGKLIGVIPEIIEEKGKSFSPVDQAIYCKSLSERKDIMISLSDVLIALPGGIGTLDEIFTVVSSATIGYTDKKVILYNISGFWNPLILLMDHLESQGMIRGDYRQRIVEAKSLDELSSVFRLLPARSSSCLR